MAKTKNVNCSTMNNNGDSVFKTTTPEKRATTKIITTKRMYSQRGRTKVKQCKLNKHKYERIIKK